MDINIFKQARICLQIREILDSEGVSTKDFVAIIAAVLGRYTEEIYEKKGEKLDRVQFIDDFVNILKKYFPEVYGEDKNNEK